MWLHQLIEKKGGRIHLWLMTHRCDSTSVQRTGSVMRILHSVCWLWGHGRHFRFKCAAAQCLKKTKAKTSWTLLRAAAKGYKASILPVWTEAIKSIFHMQRNIKPHENMAQNKKSTVCVWSLHRNYTILYGTWPAHKNMVASIWTLLHICCFYIKICMKTDIFAAVIGSTGIVWFQCSHSRIFSFYLLKGN